MKPRVLLLSIAVILVVCRNPAHGRTWVIQPDGLGDAPSIGAAVDSSASGDSVLLAAGTYTGDGNREIDYLGKAIVVASISGPALTIVDCERQGRGFYFRNGEDASAVLSGITLVRAEGPKSGGGIVCSGASPTIADSWFIDAVADGGGGAIFCIEFSSPLILGNRFIGNSAFSGGAIWCGNGSSPVIEGNVFAQNNASGSGGAIFCAAFAAATIRSNTFSENSATAQGGAIYLRDSSPLIERNIIAFSVDGEGIVCILASAPTLRCNNIFGNADGDALCGMDGGDNISVDPLFCGVAGSMNYYLQSRSPCAPVANNCGMLIGALPVFCGTTQTLGRTWGRVKAYYDETR